MSDVGSLPAPPTQPGSRHLPVVAVWVRDLLVSLAISAFIIIFLYQPVKVEGTSMMPGLEDQERIFVNKFVYRWEPIARGDIVVFRYPRDTSKSYIKRVIEKPQFPPTSLNSMPGNGFWRASCRPSPTCSSRT